MFSISENYKVSRELASQGMILLKNDGCVLPLQKKDRIGIIGKECFELIQGGGGSAKVRTEYTRSLKYGLTEKTEEGKLTVFEKSYEIAAQTEKYDVSLLNEIAKNIDTALIVWKRWGSEGSDRVLSKETFSETATLLDGEDINSKIENYEKDVGFFYASEQELELLENIERSDIKSVVLILNISSSVDLAFIEKFKKIKAVLLSYLPGMESGTAIADVLCGDRNPSGKLVDTIAYRYEDYPTSDCFDDDPYQTEYKEGIYVGYRYFETFAKEKVMFPFGFGLSYTEFDYLDPAYTRDGDQITVSVGVKNTGSVSGREIVEAYVSAPKGVLEKPAIELRGFYKTKELKPGETEKVTISFTLEDMASFDDEGVTGHKGAWVLENGAYEIFVGKSIRDLYSCGTMNIEKTLNVKQLQNRFDGSDYVFPAGKTTDAVCGKPGSLYDVAEGKLDLKEFVNSLSVEELVHLSQGQPPAFPLGTAGIGNLKEYGVPNSQTVDGPAGIRRSVNCTCFPCGTLIACSWDPELQYRMGKAMGWEGYHTGVDILLAPAMNIHRNPLCGRNFEYLSEDPLIAGKTAAAIVKGVQSEGLSATIKHFAVNNCEYKRKQNNSIVGERALREVYLKGFEIAVRESDPDFVMSSYNLLNGLHTSAHAQLLRGVLRDEWGYQGAVMTDWRNGVPLLDEILSGNNIKMPFGYPDETQKVLDAYDDGKISIDILRENAFYVLKAVMKTRSFIQKDFGVKHRVASSAVIPAVEVNGLSTTRVHQALDQDEWYMYTLGKDQRKQRTFVYYVLEVEQAGEYTITCEATKKNCPDAEIWFFDGNERRIGSLSLKDAADENKWYEFSTVISLCEGENILKLVFADEPDKDYDYFEIYKGTEDIMLKKIRLELKK